MQGQQFNSIELDTLRSPVATHTILENETILGACYGNPQTADVAGVVFIRNFTSLLPDVTEFKIPDSWEPSSPSPFPERQDVSHVHFVGRFKDKYYATDLGYDHLYEVNAETQELTIVYNFTRGFGPRHFVEDSRGFLYVIGEMTPTVVVFDEKFDQITKFEVRKAGGNWTGAEIHVDSANNIYVSCRNGGQGIGIVARYQMGGMKVMLKMREAEVGIMPRQFSLSLDEKQFIVAN